MEKVDQERIGENKSDKKIIISEFTKFLLQTIPVSVFRPMN